MATIYMILGGVAVGVAAFAARSGLRAMKRYQNLPPGVRPSAMKKYYPGGFESSMDKAEAALILGIRRSASVKKIKERHRKLIVANHPDSGGSPLIAAKINQAKELLMKDAVDEEENGKD